MTDVEEGLNAFSFVDQKLPNCLWSKYSIPFSKLYVKNNLGWPDRFSHFLCGARNKTEKSSLATWDCDKNTCIDPKNINSQKYLVMAIHKNLNPQNKYPYGIGLTIRPTLLSYSSETLIIA